MEQNRFIQRNKKKIVLRRDILRILVAVIWRFNLKKYPLSLKFCHLFVCISLKQTLCSGQQPAQICQNPDIRTVFYPVGMVSTNNQQKIYSEQIYKPQQKPFHVMFLIKKRSAGVQYLISNFIIRSIEAAIHGCSSQQVFLKITQYSEESTCVGISL